jgi:hypothetical protein
MAISDFFPLKIWQLWHKNSLYELHRSFFFGAKRQKFKKKKKKKNCIIKVWGGQFYTGKCKFYNWEWGAAKFLHARIVPLKCRMTSHVGILFCKIPLLRVSPYSENLCFVISCHTGLPQYYAR